MSIVAIIDYEAGNLTSVVRSLKALGMEGRVIKEPALVKQASRIIFPGVGAAGRAMANLERWSLAEGLREAYERGIPILGICLGAQIILDFSEENDTRCLGLLSGRTQALRKAAGLKIPHMGWNKVKFLQAHPVWQGLPADAEYYFVHSYYPQPAASEMVLGVTDYGQEFPSVVGRGNLIATQFHPEKSGRYGLQMLANFLAWDGTCAE